MLPETAKGGESPTKLTAEVDNAQVVSMTTTWRESAKKRKEAPVGVGPTMADLQSAALATWLRRLIVDGKSAISLCDVEGNHIKSADNGEAPSNG